MNSNEVKNKVIASVIIAIVASCIVSAAIANYVSMRMSQDHPGDSAYKVWCNLGNNGTEQEFLDALIGIQGIQGEQGVQGDRGEKGEPGGIEPFVSGSLTSEYHNVWLGTDYRIVTGYLINFGSETALNVRVKLTWYYSGGSYSKTQKIGWLQGHTIYRYTHTYYWEGSAGSLAWTITWD